MTTKKKNQAGFTLIELALIIAVLGILGAVGAVKLASMNDEAKDAAKSTVLANARSALAIGLAKETDGGVTVSEFLSKYFTGGVQGTGNSIDVEGKYNFQYLLDANSNITAVGTASVL